MYNTIICLVSIIHDHNLIVSHRVATVAFARLERDHGEPLVRRALGYITASRKGVTVNELEDLISLDDMVMEELSIQYKVSALREGIIEYFPTKL